MKRRANTSEEEGANLRTVQVSTREAEEVGKSETRRLRSNGEKAERIPREEGRRTYPRTRTKISSPAGHGGEGLRQGGKFRQTTPLHGKTHGNWERRCIRGEKSSRPVERVDRGLKEVAADSRFTQGPEVANGKYQSLETNVKIRGHISHKG